jgi:uncharacterized cupredoxin-like copper-binding protein
VIAATLAAGLAFLTPAPALSAPPVAHSASTAVGLGMREWSITTYRTKVKPGTVRFNVTNRGEDAHNLQVVGPHAFASKVSSDAPPAGGHARLTVKLTRPGTYTLLCEKPGHEKLGMRAKLKVVR